MADRFQEMYRAYMQGGKSTDLSFRSLVRRLLRRVQGALVNLFYLSSETDVNGTLTRSFLDAIANFRADQPTLQLSSKRAVCR